MLSFPFLSKFSVKNEDKWKILEMIENQENFFYKYMIWKIYKRNLYMTCASWCSPLNLLCPIGNKHVKIVGCFFKPAFKPLELWVIFGSLSSPQSNQWEWQDQNISPQCIPFPSHVVRSHPILIPQYFTSQPRFTSISTSAHPLFLNQHLIL